jgi:predicted nucleic acid-binding protein
MRAVFADAGYWVAIANPRDRLHARAKAIAEELGECRIVTSEMVLVEMLDGFAGYGAHFRMKAAELARGALDDPGIDVAPQTTDLFRMALALYRDRPDKNWSLTDCASFPIMDRWNIKEALTHDQYFEQNGYRALLRG